MTFNMYSILLENNVFKNNSFDFSSGAIIRIHNEDDEITMEEIDGVETSDYLGNNV